MTPPQYKPDQGDANAFSITGTLLGGIVVWGGVGWGLDHLVGTSFLVLLGVLLGAFTGVYLVYVKYGTVR